MKDLKIEYRDGKLIELVIDGEQQDASTMNSISFSHRAGGIPQLQMGRGYHFYPKHKAVGSESMLEVVEK